MAGDNDLIAAIYDTVIEPSGWDEVVKRIAEATKSVSGGISIRADAAHLTALFNVDPFYVDEYVQTYYKRNPFSAQEVTIAPGEIRTGTRDTQNDSFKASTIYNEYMRPQGWADFVAVGLVRTPNATGYLALHRSPDAIWVEPAEWHLLETLAPHLQRAAAIHDLLSQTQATTGSLGAAVAAAGFAVFLLTGDCRVVFANAKAEDLVRRGMGLRYECGRLAATSPALTARLHALARQSASPKPGEAHAGGTIELCRGENRSVFIVDPAADLGAQIQHFGARFGPAPAETRVLGEIIVGNGLPAAAARLKITELTARTHAKHIFDKTGTTRQTELIRRFFEAALPGSPGGAPVGKLSRARQEPVSKASSSS